MYLCLALGCLTKGPVAIALPGLIIVMYLLLSRPLRVIPRDILAMRPFLGALIILVLYGSWVAYMTHRYPEYPAEFFGRQNLDRFAGSGIAAIPRWMMLATFLGGLMPWVPLVGLAAWLRRPRWNMPAADKLLWIWGVTVLAVFTISKGRMPNYVLPAFPPTFALLGACLASPSDRLRRPLAIGLIATFAMLAVGLVAIAVVAHLQFDNATYLPLAISLALLAVLALPTWLFWKRTQPVLAIVPLLIATALAAAAFACGPAQAYCASRSTKTLAEPLAKLDPVAAGEVVIATEPRYGAIFYAPPGWRFRHVTMSGVGKLLPLLNDSAKPLYVILTGGGILRELQEDNIVGVHISDRLTILQRCDRDALIRIDPRVPSN
jgi:4-amino-4-deoxy-L-arabinose transferase-like glycosyltransferase